MAPKGPGFQEIQEFLNLLSAPEHHLIQVTLRFQEALAILMILCYLAFHLFLLNLVNPVVQMAQYPLKFQVSQFLPDYLANHLHLFGLAIQHLLVALLAQADQMNL